MNKNGYTPLMEAASLGHTDTVKELLSLGATVGDDALTVAKRSRQSNHSIIELLKEAYSVRYRHKYPLLQTPTHPGVTFYDKSVEKHFTSNGGSANFDNGVNVSVPASAMSPGFNASIAVRPAFAPRGVFVLPEGIVSASPSYLISGVGLTSEVTVDIEHYVQVNSREEANDLSFIEADSSPTRLLSDNSGPVYRYYEIPRARAEFAPKENKGRLKLVTRLNKFFKVGRKSKGAFLSTGHSERPPPHPDLYTVRIYRSPPDATGSRLALIIVSYFHRLFTNFLNDFERNILPQEYPRLSTSSADRTIKQPLCFAGVEASLELVCNPSWRSVPDQKVILRDEVDLPVNGQFSAEELSSCYPPKIVCQFFPEQGAVSTTATLSLHGFNKPVSVDMPLLTAPQKTVDTHQLKEASERVWRTVGEMTNSQLSCSVESVLSLVEKMATALRSSSLSELTCHTESIQTEIVSVLGVTRLVAEKCTIQSISDDIEASLSKTTTLSHQLCHVARVRLRYCQDQFEKRAALVDLVENGANLLKSVDCLLSDVNTISDISRSNTGYNVLKKCSKKIVQSLSEEPKAIALDLLSAGLITERVLQEINELNEIKADKATRLYTALLGVVKQHPHKYHEFVSVLKLNPLYTDLVSELIR